MAMASSSQQEVLGGPQDGLGRQAIGNGKNGSPTSEFSDIGSADESVFSCDPEGFYTSMHRDCGIASGPMKTIAEGRIVTPTPPENAEKSRGRSFSTHISSSTVAVPTPIKKEPTGESSPPHFSDKENDPLGNRNYDARYAKMSPKTAFPPLCEISLSESSDPEIYSPLIRRKSTSSVEQNGHRPLIKRQPPSRVVYIGRSGSGESRFQRNIENSSSLRIPPTRSQCRVPVGHNHLRQRSLPVGNGVGDTVKVGEVEIAGDEFDKWLLRKFSKEAHPRFQNGATANRYTTLPNIKKVLPNINGSLPMDIAVCSYPVNSFPRKNVRFCKAE